MAENIDRAMEVVIEEALMNKELGLNVIKKHFSDLGMEVEETINTVVASASDPYVKARLEVGYGWVVKNRGIDEGSGSLFEQAVQVILRWI